LIAEKVLLLLQHLHLKMTRGMSQTRRQMRVHGVTCPLLQLVPTCWK